jgi:CRISPR-associated protein Cmr3
MAAILEITCLDPIVCRDGRPFGEGQGNTMRSLEWVTPSMLAGALRTTLGVSAKRDFPAVIDDLLRVEVAGPFPSAEEGMYFPAPDDCVVNQQGRLLGAEPLAPDKGGCDLPAGLRPVRLIHDDDFKPVKAPAWWPADSMEKWLSGEKEFSLDDSFLCAPDKVERTHVRIDPQTRAGQEGMLFNTASLVLSHLRRYRRDLSASGPSRFAEIKLSARVRANGWCGEVLTNLDTIYPMGGERRLVHWKISQSKSWACPSKIRTALQSAKRVRMVLATPAIFDDGWKPSWLNGELIGTPPMTNVRLRLVAVTVQRWRALSGWSLADRGPKPIRRIVPAGGVYFFEILDGNAADVADRWLESVSDAEQDRRDGFGLALWGIW